MYMQNPPFYLRLCFKILRRARPFYNFVGAVYVNFNQDGTFNWAVDEVATPNDDGLVMGRVQRFIRDLIVGNTELVRVNEELRKELAELKNEENKA